MGSCGTTCGIIKEREREVRAAWAIASDARQRRGALPAAHVVSYDALVALAAKLEELLPVRVRVRLGDAGDCDALYVLAGLGRSPLVDIQDGNAPASPRETREIYIRIAVSPFGRFVALQEVRFQGSPGDEALHIVEEPEAGVVDRRLQHIVKGTQGALRKAKLVVLDLATLLAPAPDGASLHGDNATDEPPTLWSLLFEEASPKSVRASSISYRSVSPSKDGMLAQPDTR
jgi:hypothetical protein